MAPLQGEVSDLCRKATTNWWALTYPYLCRFADRSQTPFFPWIRGIYEVPSTWRALCKNHHYYAQPPRYVFSSPFYRQKTWALWRWWSPAHGSAGGELREPSVGLRSWLPGVGVSHVAPPHAFLIRGGLQEGLLSGERNSEIPSPQSLRLPRTVGLVLLISKKDI